MSKCIGAVGRRFRLLKDKLVQFTIRGKVEPQVGVLASFNDSFVTLRTENGRAIFIRTEDILKIEELNK